VAPLWLRNVPARLFADHVVPRLLAPSAELILDALPPLQPQMRFLELGPTGGVVGTALVERIAGLGRLVSADLDPQAVASMPTAPRRAARIVADRPLPFADGAFDVVVGNLVLGADADAVAFLVEVRRILKPRGRLLVTAVVRGSWDAVFDVLGQAADRDDDVVAGERLRVARAALPDEAGLFGAAAQAGLVPAASPGIEERLLACPSDGASFAGDALVTDVLVAAWLGERRPQPATLDDVVRHRATGVPVVVRTAVLVLRPA
jgi:SAM-dependent methyltransferase